MLSTRTLHVLSWASFIVRGSGKIVLGTAQEVSECDRDWHFFSRPFLPLPQFLEEQGTTSVHLTSPSERDRSISLRSNLGAVDIVTEP